MYELFKILLGSFIIIFVIISAVAIEVLLLIVKQMKKDLNKFKK